MWNILQQIPSEPNYIQYPDILLSSKYFSVQNELCTKSFPILSNGLYYLKLYNVDTGRAYKIIKR